MKGSAPAGVLAKAISLASAVKRGADGGVAHLATKGDTISITCRPSARSRPALLRRFMNQARLPSLSGVSPPCFPALRPTRSLRSKRPRARSMWSLEVAVYDWLLFPLSNCPRQLPLHTKLDESRLAVPTASSCSRRSRPPMRGAPGSIWPGHFGTASMVGLSPCPPMAAG
jgi:hypothetical protein